jgi:hypothetical protein
MPSTWNNCTHPRGPRGLRRARPASTCPRKRPRSTSHRGHSARIGAQGPPRIGHPGPERPPRTSPTPTPTATPQPTRPAAPARRSCCSVPPTAPTPGRAPTALSPPGPVPRRLRLRTPSPAPNRPLTGAQMRAYSTEDIEAAPTSTARQPGAGRASSLIQAVEIAVADRERMGRATPNLDRLDNEVKRHTDVVGCSPKPRDLATSGPRRPARVQRRRAAHRPSLPLRSHHGPAHPTATAGRTGHAATDDAMI